MHGIRNDGEIGPDLIIEDMRAKKGDDFGQSPYLQWRFAHCCYRIHQQRQAGNVIQVRVREYDMVDTRHRLKRQRAKTRAGIDKHGVIE